MSVSGIISASMLISIKDSNNFSFIALFNLFFYYFLFLKCTVKVHLSTGQSENIYLYAKYKFENADVCKLYLYKYSNKYGGQMQQPTSFPDLLVIVLK